MKQLIIFLCISCQFGVVSYCLPARPAADCLAPAIHINSHVFIDIKDWEKAEIDGQKQNIIANLDEIANILSGINESSGDLIREFESGRQEKLNLLLSDLSAKINELMERYKNFVQDNKVLSIGLSRSFQHAFGNAVNSIETALGLAESFKKGTKWEQRLEPVRDIQARNAAFTKYIEDMKSSLAAFPVHELEERREEEIRTLHVIARLLEWEKQLSEIIGKILEMKIMEGEQREAQDEKIEKSFLQLGVLREKVLRNAADPGIGILLLSQKDRIDRLLGGLEEHIEFPDQESFETVLDRSVETFIGFRREIDELIVGLTSDHKRKAPSQNQPVKLHASMFVRETISPQVAGSVVRIVTAAERRINTIGAVVIQLQSDIDTFDPLALRKRNVTKKTAEIKIAAKEIGIELKKIKGLLKNNKLFSQAEISKAIKGISALQGALEKVNGQLTAAMRANVAPLARANAHVAEQLKLLRRSLVAALFDFDQGRDLGPAMQSASSSIQAKPKKLIRPAQDARNPPQPAGQEAQGALVTYQGQQKALWALLSALKEQTELINTSGISTEEMAQYWRTITNLLDAFEKAYDQFTKKVSARSADELTTALSDIFTHIATLTYNSIMIHPDLRSVDLDVNNAAELLAQSRKLGSNIDSMMRTIPPHVEALLLQIVGQIEGQSPVAGTRRDLPDARALQESI